MVDTMPGEPGSVNVGNMVPGVGYPHTSYMMLGRTAGYLIQFELNHQREVF